MGYTYFFPREVSSIATLISYGLRSGLDNWCPQSIMKWGKATWIQTSTPGKKGSLRRNILLGSSTKESLPCRYIISWTCTTTPVFPFRTRLPSTISNIFNQYWCPPKCPPSELSSWPWYHTAHPLGSFHTDHTTAHVNTGWISLLLQCGIDRWQGRAWQYLPSYYFPPHHPHLFLSLPPRNIRRVQRGLLILEPLRVIKDFPEGGVLSYPAHLGVGGPPPPLRWTDIRGKGRFNKGVGEKCWFRFNWIDRSFRHFQ